MIPRLSLLLGLVCLASCNESDAPSDPSDDTAQFSGPWDYLRGTYDGNGDGRVTSAEHGRTAGSFERLDRNQDGVLDLSDFERRIRGGGQKAADRAVHLIGQFFQHDADGSLLAAQELEAAFQNHDSDHDGLVTEEEFRCGQLAAGPWAPAGTPVVARLLDGVDPWEGLLAALDGDGDRALGLSEVLDFHVARGQGEAWAWEVLSEEQLRQQRPLEGQLAPDFTLSPLRGGPPVTLSSLRGDRPVALIFGSYT
ncbi:MAG: EF-hand domain-containing protein [Planctomycetota bacterium]|nr:EF-hand domain-containing protein [Planctomycetota bacterium]